LAAMILRFVIVATPGMRGTSDVGETYSTLGETSLTGWVLRSSFVKKRSKSQKFQSGTVIAEELEERGIGTVNHYSKEKKS
jgi:hypothetical protein